MHINPKTLKSLAQASYVAQCLVCGEHQRDIAIKFGSDDELVKLWTSFLLHNHYISKNFYDRWTLTDKGKRLVKDYHYSQ